MTSDSLPRRVLPWLDAHRIELLLLFFGVLLPLLAFGLIAQDVIAQRPFAIDRWLPFWLHGYASPALDRLMLVVSFVGSVRLMAPIDALVMLVLAWRRRWRATVFWILATGGAALLNVVAKHLVQRVRPDYWISIAPETNFSFPSGHAMASMAFAAGLLVLAWRTRARGPLLLLGVLFVLLVGASRVYLGVHFPTDILAGWAAALAWVIGVRLVLGNRER